MHERLNDKQKSMWAKAAYMAEMAAFVGKAQVTQLGPVLTSAFNDARAACAMEQWPIRLIGVYAQMPFQVHGGPTTGGDNAIGVNPFVADFLPRPNLDAILAHEMGHIHNHDSLQLRNFLSARGIPSANSSVIDYDDIRDFWESIPDAETTVKPMMYAHEFGADQFAKDHGYGPALADALRFLNDADEMDHESLTHPAPTERIRRLLQ